MPSEIWQNEQIFLGCIFPECLIPAFKPEHLKKTPHLAINGNKSVLQPGQCIQSVYKQMCMFMPARWVSSFVLETAQLYKPCLSNQSCVCTRKSNMAGTVPWCWGQGRWKQCMHIPDLLSPPCSAHKLPVESGPSPCQLLACAWELFGKVGPSSAVPGTALTIKQHRQLPSSAWKRSPELLHLPRWALALDSSFGRSSLASPDFKRREANKQNPMAFRGAVLLHVVLLRAWEICKYTGSIDLPQIALHWQ